MIRKITYEIPENMLGHKISEFLHSKGYCHQNLVELKKMDHSVLIGDRWEYLTYRLQPGDVLTIVIQDHKVSEKIPAVDLPFPVVYEDEDICVVNKPAHMPIHPSMKHYENTLGNAAAYYFEKKGMNFKYRCVNRLDKDTTGLTCLAMHLVSCSMLYDQVTDGRLKREYFAIVENADIPDEGIVDLPLARNEDSAIERMVDFERGLRAVTHYRVLDRKSRDEIAGLRRENDPWAAGDIPKKGLAFLSLHLETGRTHQIRVHMMSIGHPLIGDFLYNPKSNLMDRQALHAGHLSFIHPITGEPVRYTAPLPEDMARFFDPKLLERG